MNTNVNLNVSAQFNKEATCAVGAVSIAVTIIVCYAIYKDYVLNSNNCALGPQTDFD